MRLDSVEVKTLPTKKLYALNCSDHSGFFSPLLLHECRNLYPPSFPRLVWRRESELSRVDGR